MFDNLFWCAFEAEACLDREIFGSLIWARPFLRQENWLSLLDSNSLSAADEESQHAI
jgi:hypothetical protein